MFSTGKQHRSILRFAAALLSSSALLLGGCALQSNAPEGNAFATDATLSGKLMGANGPIAGTTVNLYAVGTTGYGTGATLLATTTTAATTGAFSFTQSGSLNGPTSTVSSTYGCPTASTLLYITGASGDSTGVGTAANFNTNIKFIDAIGACSSAASSYIFINEVSTVVTLAALQQYINPVTEVIGSPSTTPSSSKMARAVTGIANAFNLVNILITQASGSVNATINQAGTVGTVTVTPEVTKINTIADILAACVNTTGSASTYCGGTSGLFAAATPPQVPSATNFPNAYTTSLVAKDTLQAALFMLENPTDAGTQVTSCAFGTATTNIGCLYAALTGVGAPFTGVGTAPTDWTVAVSYGSNSLTGSAYLLSEPGTLAIDATGNVWALNYVSGTAAGANSITQLSPVGLPLQQGLQAALIGPAGIAIDPSNNVWVADYGSSSALQSFVSEYTAAGATNSFPTNKGPQALTIDGQGNVLVLEPSYKGLGDLEEIYTSAASGTTATTLASGITTDFSNLVVDGNNTVWITGGGTGALNGTSGYPYLFQFLYTSGTAPNYPTTPSATTNAGGITAPETTITVDSSNDIWVVNYAKSTLAELGGTTTVAGVGSAPYTATGLATPQGEAIDGAGNVWASNYVSKLGAIFEYANTGAALSPTVGYAHTYGGARGVAIDPSGNVWVGDYSIAASSTVQSYLTQIVGAAVPVVTPIAASLPSTPFGTNHLGTTPQ